MARNPCTAPAALLVAFLAFLAFLACLVACAAPPPVAPAPRPPVAPPSTVSPPTTPCEGSDLDLTLATARCACSTAETPTDHTCSGASDDESPDLVVVAHALPPHVASGGVLQVDLMLENHGTTPLRVDLPPAFRPELVVFSPQGARIEPPNGTTTCPLADTLRFVSGKVRVVITAGGRAHAALPWSARAVAWDDTRHLESGRCAMSRRDPLAKGTYEIKVIADLLGIASDDPGRNPRLKVEVQ